MGILGGTITLENKTQYRWTVCFVGEAWPRATQYVTHNLGAFGTVQGRWVVPVTWGKTFYIKVKYGDCSKEECNKSPDLWYKLNPKDDPNFTLRESGDLSQIHLDCNIRYDEKKSTCPNYGKIEDDARQREEKEKEEERRQQVQREQEKRIEEQLKRKYEISAKKQKQILRRQVFQQQSQIIQQPPAIYTGQRDEVAEIEEKFNELLVKFEITESEDSEESLCSRIKCLQNETLHIYCKKHNLSSSCLLSLDAVVGYDTLPLTDRLSVLEAVLYLVFEDSSDDHTHKVDRDIFLCLLEQLNDTHPSLAGKLLQNMLCTDVKLSTENKEILGQILFNNLWTQEEITDFMQKTSVKDDDHVYKILHMAQTHKLDYKHVSTALSDRDPVRILKYHVDSEGDKDAKTILSEMRQANLPENVLTILEDVLRYVEKELPKNAKATLTNREIKVLKKMIQSLDFNNPERDVLKEVLIKMSVAVKMCSGISIQQGEKYTVIEGYLPRLTQLASLVVFLLPKSKANSGCLLEIGTGEGKSCILAMLAAIHAIRCVNVDLVTSSPVLAYRDLEQWRTLYDMFGITSSAVPPPLSDSTPEQQDELIQNAYKQQVVYSTVGTFAADTLRQEFEKKTTRGERKFDMVIVDEVDYMTLDNGVQITFLSHESSALQHLEQVLAGIWAMTSACQPIEMAETGEIMWATRVQSFHTAALIAMIGFDKSDNFSPLEILLPGCELGFYSEEDFVKLEASIKEGGDIEEDCTWKTLMAKTGVEQQYDLLSVLEIGMENNVAFNCYRYQSEIRKAVAFGERKTKADQKINMLLLENGKACEIMSEQLLVEATVSEIKSKIKYSKQCASPEDTQNLVIPSFLDKYLEIQLPFFVQNALKAIQMTKGREYMIAQSLRAQGMDFNEENLHMFQTVIPVDFQASGVLEKQKQWGDGLQQFLQMKHQLALSPLSNVTNYMSNSSFFKRYLSGKGIFGVSGTLGGDADKSFLVRHYKTDCYVIPAHQRKKVTELPAVQVRGGTDQWIQEICDTVSKVSARSQVVLVVCEDVNTANAVKEKISIGCKHSVTMYTMSEGHSIENQTFAEGEVIITTNLGGRGTDIKIKKKVNLCGGLFVILSYFPNNRRVEQQIFGRTGRKGTPGMVQLILNHDQLPQAYQGHSTETMRKLREEFESKRITDMEKEKLVEIQMKEELFSLFCQFLSDFATAQKNYSTEEKTDLFEVRVENTPRYFESYKHKMDYHPALNALKESWGLWLVLHTDKINTQNDINHLKEDLLQHLKTKSKQLLVGDSEHFYDHIQQALGRTALHFQNKTKCDYGAKEYWEKVSKSDSYYRAAALYNQAYIMINMAKKNYKNEATDLLEEAKSAIDVYVSETTNTLNSVSLSITGAFEPHNSDSCNFQLQMQARINMFQLWKKNIEELLTGLKSGKENVITVDSTFESLSPNEDFVSASEISLFHKYGLAVVFTVKKKPRFSFDGLICCFLGVVQVVAGVLTCALSAGALSSFGLSLISEGVSDMISGITGMINGSFDWASWAMSKAISIGVSLAFGGFRVLRRMCTSVKNAASEIFKGTTTLRNVACSALQSGKRQFMSISGSIKSVVSSINIKNLSTLCTSNTVHLTLKQASKYAVQELAIQGVNTALNKCIDATIQMSFRCAFQQKCKDSVCTNLKQNKDFVHAISKFISSKIGNVELDKTGKINKNLEDELKNYLDFKLKNIFGNLMATCKQVQQIINQLSHVWNLSAEHIAQNPHSCIKTLLSKTSTCLELYSLYSAIPTKHTIDNKIVPPFLEAMDEEAMSETLDKDEEDKLNYVERLRDEIIDSISESLSQEMIHCISGSTSSIFTKTYGQKINAATGKVVGNLLGRHDTQNFFVNQQHFYDLKSSKEKKNESLSETEKQVVADYAKGVTDENTPATALEVHVLTQSDLLEGKGICVTVVDDQGKLLTEEIYPGTDPEAGVIKILLTKTPLNSTKTKGVFDKLKSRIKGEDIPHSGHADIIRPDGSKEAVNSENQNCLFQAVIQATNNLPEHVLKEKAKELRNDVSNEILNNPKTYIDAVRIQKMFNNTQIGNRYQIQAGLTRKNKKEFRDYIKNIQNEEMENILISGLGLGKVDQHEILTAEEKPTKGAVEADHFIPKKTMTDVYTDIKRNPNLAAELKQNNPKLYDLVMGMGKDQNGKLQLCMNTLWFDHRQALTSGNCKESHKCRKLLGDILKKGDTEKLVKFACIMAHPESSGYIRHDLGISHNYNTERYGVPETATKTYYKEGFQNIIKKFSDMGVIDQNKKMVY